MGFKYVNMADITRDPSANLRNGSSAAAAEGQSAPGKPRDSLIAHVELLFFAYRDFTGDADAVLDQFGFGRAHHRVLHFVSRNPGLRVANLLDILKITKQSLARVLKQLIGDGFIVQRAGAEDRRERLLYLTSKGTRLADRLMALQVQRVDEALAAVGPEAEAATKKFLLAMISPEDRDQVKALVSASATDGESGGKDGT